MRKTVLAFFSALCVASPAFSDVNDGLAAYQNGDYATAFTEFSTEAAEGTPEAEYNLGLLYFFGLGVTQDYAAALEWIGRAAIHDYAPAQFMLGAMYERGEGHSANINLARAWYELAAQQGHVDAHRAGMLIALGDTAEADRVGVVVWLTLASGKGHAEAQANLAKVSEGLTSAELIAVGQLADTFQERAARAADE